ncbi:cathepsin L-like proteinase [Euwallacea similis]|uniref:cathepsin L-like proteinase n=1 Tax=Euwallacea similis TaxID=1736056 RepID=UPI00344ED43B
MFVKMFLLCCLIAAVSANQEEFDNFKLKFGKAYATASDHQQRYEIFKSNLQEIQEHNDKYDQGLVSWFKAVNQFCDLTTEEFKTLYLTRNMLEDDHSEHHKVHELITEIPDKIDWRTEGYVTAVKDQGMCGSCWAFSTTGTLEGAYAKKYGKLVEFSEQELIDCSTISAGYNCKGCCGGRMDEALRYVIDHGIVTEEFYPYQEKMAICRQNGSVFQISDVIKIPKNDEDSLKNAVGSVGPVSVALNCDDIKNYGGGIYDNEECSTVVNHAVLAVGYDSADGMDYWIFKNQWNTTWGEDGYIRMKIGKNLCGLARQACYAKV